MDRRRLHQKQADYADRVLRLDRSLMHRIGMIRSRTHLKVDDYFVNCIPYDLSLKRCRVISILDPKEIKFFGEYRGGIHNLHLTVNNAMFGREISMYAKVKLKELRQPNPETSVCLIDLDLMTVPNDLAEILVTLFEELDQARAAYDKAVAEETPRSLADLYPAWPHRYGRIERGGETIAAAARVVTIAAHRARLFVDLPDGPPELEAVVEVVFGDADDQLFVKGKISAVEDSKEVPQCVILTLDFEFSAPFVERLSQAMKGAESGAPASGAPAPATSGGSDTGAATTGMEPLPNA